MGAATGDLVYCSLCGAPFRRSELQQHRSAVHPEAVRALDSATREFKRRYSRFAFPSGVAWLATFLFSVFFVFGRVAWWRAWLAVLVDTILLLLVVGTLYAREDWARSTQALQHVQTRCPLCAEQVERHQFLGHLATRHPQAAHFAKVSRVGTAVLLVALVALPLGLENLALFGVIPDSYVTDAIVLVFVLAAILGGWLVLVGRVLWGRLTQSPQTMGPNGSQ